MSHKAYLLMGGNQGDRFALLQKATDLIQERVGSVVGLSRLYETEPWGNFEETESEPQSTKAFINQALAVTSLLAPHDLLHTTMEIEAELGRIRPCSEPHTPHQNTRLYHSRPIDIDIIFYDAEVMDTPDLTIPHPRMHLRRFVLTPLCDIAPDFVHPVLNKTITQLLSECEDTCSCYCCS